MNERITSVGAGFQVALPNGQVVKSENKKALEDLLAKAEHKARREERFTLAWNNAADLVEPRFCMQVFGQGPVKDKALRVKLNLRQIDLAIGRLSKAESAFLAALVAFDEPPKGRELLARIGCLDIQQLAESLHAKHAHAIAQLFLACRDG